MMGDGPGYDHMYSVQAERRRTKAKRQNERFEMMHAMLQKVGFGDSDPDNQLLEKELVRHLQMAYELLIMFRSSRKP